MSAFLCYRKIVYLISGALILGCAVIVRPAPIYYVYILMLFLFFLPPFLFKKNLKMTFLFLLSFCVPVFGYMSYNKYMYKSFVITSLVEEGIYHYFSAKILSQVDGISFEEAEKKLMSLVDSSVNLLEDSYWSSLRDSFLKLSFSHPLITLSLVVKHFFQTLVGNYTTQLKVFLDPQFKGGSCSFFKGDGNVVCKLYRYIVYGSSSMMIKIIGWCEFLFNLIRFFLVLGMFWLLLNLKKFKITLFLMFYFIYFLAITAFEGCARYRLMNEVIFIMLTSCGLYLFYCYLFSKDNLWRSLFNQKVKKIS